MELNLEQYLNTEKNHYEMEKVTELVEKQEKFYVFSYYPPFPRNVEYMTGLVNNINCILVFTSEEMARNCYPNLQDWKITEVTFEKLEQIMKRYNSNSFCINYGTNWIVLTMQ